MSFDLGKLLADTSDINAQEQIEYIDASLIDSDEKNFYNLSNIEGLANNIATIGLQQPLRVRAENGRYRTVSGHRRRAAIELLREDVPERWQKIPCIVERDAASPSLQQLRLIYANANSRMFTSADLAEQAAQVETLLYRLKEEGYEFPGRMRDHVAQAVNASKTKLARLRVIRENLTDCWKDAWQKNELRELPAYRLAQMPSEWQKILYDLYHLRSSALSEDAIVEFGRRFKRIAKYQCAHCADGVCAHADVMMRVSARERYTDSCLGCCAECLSLATCRNSCLGAAEKKRELRDTRAQAEARAKAAVEEREHPLIEYARACYRRIGKARASAGVSVQELYAAQKKMYASSDIKKQVKLESDPNAINSTMVTIFGYGVRAADLQIICAVADLLGVTTDYLLGHDCPEPPSTEGGGVNEQM